MRALIHLGPNLGDPGADWNRLEIPGAGGTGNLPANLALHDTATNALPWIITPNQVTQATASTGSPAGILYPDICEQGFLFLSDNGASGSTIEPFLLTTTGLDPDKEYVAILFASRAGVVDNRTAVYQAIPNTPSADSTVTQLDAANNVDSVAIMSAIWPDNTGQTVFRMIHAGANNNANHFTYWSVLDLTENNTTQLPGLPDESGDTVVFGWMGSSTLVEDEGSGTVPDLCGGASVSATGGTVSTQNGAVGGTTTVDWLPGEPASDNLKNAVTAADGYKVLRILLGSNDARVARSVEDYLANMATIIADALTWPVDKIIVEQIGYRTEGGAPTQDLIQAYNAALPTLAAANVLIGTATTYEDQLAQNTLLGDGTHQNDIGNILLACHLARETYGFFGVNH